MLRICYYTGEMRLIRNTTAIGRVLSDRRKELGKSAAWVAATVGVPRSTVARIESGKINPTWSIVLGLSQALDLQPVLVPRERMTAVETVMKVSDAPETPPIAGDEW
jgi:DNA-binding XRE family transcriptional regulator